MGIRTRGAAGSDKTFLSIFNGSLVIEYDTEEKLENKLSALGFDVDIESRKKTKGKNEGKEVFFASLYDVSGMLTGISLKEISFAGGAEEFLELEITDVDEKFIVSLGSVFQRMSKNFIQKLGNIDLSQEVTISPFSMSKEESSTGKPVSGVTIYQNDKKLSYFFEKDEVPAPKQTKRGRAVTWDWSEHDNFLYDYLYDYIQDNFKPEVKSEALPEKEEEAPKPKRKKATAKSKSGARPF